MNNANKNPHLPTQEFPTRRLPLVMLHDAGNRESRMENESFFSERIVDLGCGARIPVLISFASFLVSGGLVKGGEGRND